MTSEVRSDSPAPKSAEPAARSRRRLLPLLALLYSLLVVYGSLYPLSGWLNPHTSMFGFLSAPAPAHISRADVLTNFIAYFPLGVLLAICFRFSSMAGSFVLATSLGSSLSFAMEAVQTFLPTRTSSKIDFIVNVVGTATGALVGLTFRETNIIRANFQHARTTWFQEGSGVDVAIAAVALWAASQLSPFVPSMDVSSIGDGLRLFRMELIFPGLISLPKIATYSFNIAGVGLLLSVAARRSRVARWWFLGFAATVLVMKPFIVTRQLTAESLCGLVTAAILLFVFPKQRAAGTLLAMACLLLGFVTAELAPGSVGGLHGFNWVPFAGQLDDTVSGFGSILDTAAPFTSLAALAMLGFGRRRGPMLTIGGLLMGLVFACEWIQTSIEGRYGDITTVLVAGVSWLIGWTYFFMNEPELIRHPSGSRRHTVGQSDTPPGAIAGAVE